MRDSRISEMKEYIEKCGIVSMEELSKVFEVSVVTVRRDVSELQQAGAIEKVYGGVRKKDRGNLINFEDRETTNSEAKMLIGREAAKLLADQDIVFVDSGTTTSCAIDYLGDKRITVLTASLEVIEKAVKNDNIKLISLTGMYNRATNSFAGITTSEALGKFNITKALMAASGVTIESGLTHASPWEYEIKTEAVKKAGQVILMADSTKFDAVTLVTYCSLSKVDTVVTNEYPPEKFLEYFKEHHMELRVGEGGRQLRP